MKAKVLRRKAKSRKRNPKMVVDGAGVKRIQAQMNLRRLNDKTAWDRMCLTGKAIREIDE